MNLARIVVLNYNGRALLEQCLPSIIEAAKQSRMGCAVTVLDNCSADDSESWVKQNCHSVEWVRAAANKILCSYNEYAQKTTEKYLIFLNNDIRVEPGFVDPLLAPLEADKNIFFTTPLVRTLDTGKYEGSLSKMQPRFGLLWGDARFLGHEQKIGQETLTMQCGFGAFRREYFLKLGGYDDLYLPGTVEDSDLCFRGYRQGWVGFFVPTSVVHHMGQVSFKKEFGVNRLRRINRRNLYLFMWKNIRSPWYGVLHAASIPLHILKYALRGEKDFLGGFADACSLYSKAMEKRRASSSEKSVWTDRKIFAVSRAI